MRLTHSLTAILLTVSLGACSGAAAETTDSEESAVKDGQTVRLLSVHSGLALDVAGKSHLHGAALQQWSYGKSTNQRFSLHAMGDGSYELVGVGSGKCVDVTDVSKDAGERVQQWDCWGGPNQRWKLVDEGNGASEVVSVNSGMCLDVEHASKAAGARVDQWPCHGGDNQKWRVEQVDASGSPVGSPAACSDEAPDASYTCAQQAGWGKCGESWMSGFCDASCGRCGSGHTGASIGMNIIPVLEPYILGWDQESVTAADPSRPFRVAKANGITRVRVALAGRQEIVQRWKANPTAFWKAYRRVLDDAHAQGLTLAIHNRLEKGVIEVLAGHGYGSWEDAQRDVTTKGSAAWNGYRAFLQEAVTEVGGHPAIHSWEVVNEPQWMLGYDSGAVSKDAVIEFVNAFQGALHSFGVKRVHMGGAYFDDLDDTRFRRVYEHTDLFDAHLYPDGGDASAAINRVEAVHARVQALSGRDLPIMLGEIGTVPWSGWSKPILDTCHQQGWTCLAWGFDAWDENAFDDASRPEVLAHVRTLDLGP